MSYEKPSFFSLGSATIAIHGLGHESGPNGAAKHSPLYESCTGHGPGGTEMIGPTSSTSSAYEADE
ncbi:MAG TPA: hypothetical protein VEW05_12010 [Candidatus Polarisedimenticolia bacterium]|nr:hypothetical protein [Candidatus Polarisedimenticolia bacterium]